MIRKSKFSLAICTGLILLLLIFIWGNSLMPGQTSGQISGWFGKLLGRILPVFGPDNPSGSYLLRKCAHFCEFAALGILLTWFFAMLYSRKRFIALWAILGGATTAAIDETIQRFIPARHGCIQDVALDSCGVLTGVLLLLLIFHLYGKKPSA